MNLPGVYRAKAVKLDGKALTTYIPQVFGDTSISITDIAGDPPATFPAMGWVVFQSGSQEAPVWLGTADLSRVPQYFTSSSEYRFNATITAPPTNSQIRFNNADQKLATTMWIHQSTANGITIPGLLLAVHKDTSLYLQDEADLAIWQTYTVTGPSVASASYNTIPVVWKKGGKPLLAQDVLLIIVAEMGDRIP